MQIVQPPAEEGQRWRRCGERGRRKRGKGSGSRPRAGRMINPDLAHVTLWVDYLESFCQRGLGCPQDPAGAKDRGLLEPLRLAARRRCPRHKVSGAAKEALEPWLRVHHGQGSSLGMADPAVFIRKFLQDRSGPVFHAACGKDRGCSL